MIQLLVDLKDKLLHYQRVTGQDYRVGTIISARKPTSNPEQVVSSHEGICVSELRLCSHILTFQSLLVFIGKIETLEPPKNGADRPDPLPFRWEREGGIFSKGYLI